MTTTDNHEYNVPAKGTSDWAVPLNENFEAMEQDVTVVDAHATVDPSVDPDISTVQYTPHDDALFVAFDTGAVFRGDGSTWSQIGAIPLSLDVTKSGDGSQTAFTVSHGLPTAPSSIHLQPTSQAAAGIHWVSNKTSSDFEITYANAPESGTDNITFDVSLEV